MRVIRGGLGNVDGRRLLALVLLVVLWPAVKLGEWRMGRKLLKQPIRTR